MRSSKFNFLAYNYAWFFTFGAFKAKAIGAGFDMSNKTIGFIFASIICFGPDLSPVYTSNFYVTTFMRQFLFASVDEGNWPVFM